MLSCLLALSLAAPQTPWTVLVYGASDNDSERSFVPDLVDLGRGLPPSGVECLALVDRSPEWSSEPGGFGEDFDDTRLYRVRPDGMERLAGGHEFPEIRLDGSYEANTGSAETLRKFLRFARAESPSEHYALILYSHGGGYSFCPDEASGDELYTAELTQALAEEDSLDLCVFDVCLMAGLENAYEWRPAPGKFGIDVLVATPNAGAPFPWLDILSRVREGGSDTIAPAELTPLRFGRLIVEQMEAHRRRELEIAPQNARFVVREAMACLNLSRAEPVKERLDEVARALAAGDTRSVVEAVRGVGPHSVAMHYVPEGEPQAWFDMPYYDVFDLATRLAGEERLSADVRSAARELAASVDELVVASFGMSHYAGFEPGRHGVHVAFPNGEIEDAYGSSGFRYLGWLHPESRTALQHAFGDYAFCRDGAIPGNGVVETWFELLDSWYDAEDTNGYRW